MRPESSIVIVVCVEDDRIRARGSRAALAGVAFAVLFVVGWLLLQEAPSRDASAAELVAYYSDPDLRRGSVIAGLYIVPFAAIAFVWFLAALRARYIQSSGREHTLLATVHLLAGVLFTASLFSVAATKLALVWLADAPGELDADSLRVMISLGEATSDIMALRSGAVFIAVSTTRGVRSGLFPRWFGAASLVLALVMLLAYDGLPQLALLMPLWVVGTSVIVLERRTTRDLTEGT